MKEPKRKRVIVTRNAGTYKASARVHLVNRHDAGHTVCGLACDVAANETLANVTCGNCERMKFAETC